MSETKDEEQETITQQSTPESIGEHKQPLTRQQRTDRWFQVVTAIMLGVVAVATAWSGYQATRWAGEQSTLYAQASALRVESTRTRHLQDNTNYTTLSLLIIGSMHMSRAILNWQKSFRGASGLSYK